MIVLKITNILWFNFKIKIKILILSNIYISVNYLLKIDNFICITIY